MKFGSVCSGIEAASVAWEPLGWSASWFAEIDPFPSAVLAHHYPEVPNVGDMTLLSYLVGSGILEAPDVLVGGTPCQAFSVAGARKSLDDDRGQLSLEFIKLANAIDERRNDKPSIIVWENVPGVLSTKDNAFGCFLGALAGEDVPLDPTGARWENAGCVYGPQRAIAWRVLDAQYFGVAQRRRRVFVVASARADFDPAQVLFEFDGVRRDIAPSRSSGQETTGSTGKGSGGPTGSETGNLAIHLQVVHGTQDPIIQNNQAFPLGRNQGQENIVLFEPRSADGVPRLPPDQTLVPTLNTMSGGQREPCVSLHGAVRRLTPIECERLQGFPDNWTRVPYRKKPAEECPDGPRYAACGNSMAVPVMEWIGRRIDAHVITA